MWDDSLLPDPEQVEAMRQETYEASVVKHLLRKLDKLPCEKEIRQFYDSLDGKPRLGFCGFDQVIEDFPLTLTTKKMRKITHQTLIDLHRRPTKTPIWEAFEEAKHDFPEAYEAGTLGLVFAWPDWSYHMVFHVWDSLLLRTGCRFVWYPGRSRRPHIMETLDQILVAIGVGSAPPDE